MNIQINKRATIPIYLQISNQIKDMILRERLAEGFSLPSQREMGKLLDVHRNTVIRAYSILEDEGFISPKQGIGYKVCGLVSEREKPCITNGKVKSRASIKCVNWESIIKEEYLNPESTFDDLFSKSYETGKISFAGGMPSNEIYDNHQVGVTLGELIDQGNRGAAFYTPYQGDFSLRQNLAAYAGTKGIGIKPGEIQVMSETNQAVEFIVNLLMEKGETVIAEEPLSPDIYRAINLAGGNILSVPLDEEGMLCENIEHLLQKHKPKFIYVNSSYHDPTGIMMSMKRRKKILELSYKYRIPIVEDDAASELYYEGEGPPPLKAFDKGNNVIYIYSFSLTFVPGMSMAFIAAPKAIIKSLSYLVSVRLISLDWLSQKLLDKYLEEGIYLNKLKKIRKSYQKKRDLMCFWLDSLKEIGIKYSKPSGGVYIWCELPDELSSENLVASLSKEGVSYIPGHVFFSNSKQGKSFIRLNFSYPTEEEIQRGMKIFVTTAKELVYKKTQTVALLVTRKI